MWKFLIYSQESIWEYISSTIEIVECIFGESITLNKTVTFWEENNFEWKKNLTLSPPTLSFSPLTTPKQSKIIIFNLLFH